MTDPPRQLADFQLLPGVIKSDYEDFVVEELPLYPTDGTGTHTYFLLEKAGLTTHQAIHDVARALGVPRFAIGFAGLKDARAVTRQWMSVEHVPPERVAALDIPRLRVLETGRHNNKLRIGHLKGNHFAIKVRQTRPERLADVQAALAHLHTDGVPNYFGQQRFGNRGDTWELGRAVLRGNIDEALDLLLGRPTEQDYGDVRRARQLYDGGQYAAAARAWPHHFRTERRALKILARPDGKRRRAYASVDRVTRSLFTSAYQSYLFNRVVADRLPGRLGRLLDGDLAWVHATRAVFRVDHAASEQPRADRFEISPTGPLFGYRMTTPAGAPAEHEAGLLAAEDLVPDSFRSGPVRIKGGRRPLRFQPLQPHAALGADGRGEYLALEFALPRGCYATALLRELFALPAGADGDTVGEETEASPQ